MGIDGDTVPLCSSLTIIHSGAFECRFCSRDDYEEFRKMGKRVGNSSLLSSEHLFVLFNGSVMNDKVTTYVERQILSSRHHLKYGNV